MKKGSLQLSINAIVIIILAITLLGLGLTFMRQFLGAGTANLYEIFESVNLENPATALEPLTIESITLESGAKPESFFVGFYCDSASTCTNAEFQIVECVDSEGTSFGVDSGGTAHDNVLSGANGINLDLVAVPHDVEAHKSVGFRVLMSWKQQDGEPGRLICRALVDDPTATTTSSWAKQEQISINLG